MDFKKFNNIDIDKVPLTFGKWKGRAPEQIFKDRDYAYLEWLYINVDEPVMSDELFENVQDSLEQQQEFNGLGGEIGFWKG